MNFAVITDSDTNKETVVNLDRINVIEATREGSVVYMAGGGQIRFKGTTPKEVATRLAAALIK